MPLNPIDAASRVVHVSPIRGVPQWWHVTDLDGLSFAGAFPWAATQEPADEQRHERYRLAYGEQAPATWRFASLEETSFILFEAMSTT
ncbi:MAG TPA: hypothetical protein VNT52_18450 [Acidimicrobiales bacterium]|nr:hypothetical protein [Acidimicrobiales bacterium]